jgi:insecticidal toxin complex protein TccC
LGFGATVVVISLEPYQQTYSYDTGSNLTALSHQANSSTWQQTLTIRPNSNRGTENNNQNNFDTNGNLLGFKCFYAYQFFML